MEISAFYILIYTIEGFIFGNYAIRLFDSKFHWHLQVSMLFIFYSGLYLLSRLELSWSCNTVTFLAANFCFLLLMYRLTWYTALFHAVAATFLMGISEFIPYSILFSFFHSSGKPNDYFFSLVLLTAISKTLYFTFMTLLAHYEKRIRDIPPDKTFFFLISIPIISLFLMLSLFFISENGNLPTFINCMISASAVLLLICNLLVYAADSYSKKRNQSFTELSLQLQKEQDATDYYKLLLRQNENQNILIHDIKKHINMISVLNDKNEPEKIAEYISLLIQSPALKESAHLCDREILDAILCRYQTRCREAGVTFHTDIRSGTTEFVTDTDMTSLFSNLLENALESATGTAEAFIELSVSHRENTPYTVLVMTNSCGSDPFVRHGERLPTSKPDKGRHGYGMKSVCRIVEKYHGEIQNYYEGSTQTFHTILTLRQEP